MTNAVMPSHVGKVTFTIAKGSDVQVTQFLGFIAMMTLCDSRDLIGRPRTRDVL
jgi:hypothetical protein